MGIVIRRPKVVSGSTLVVPEKESQQSDWKDPASITMYTSVLSAMTTAFIGVVTLLKP